MLLHLVSRVGRTSWGEMSRPRNLPQWERPIPYKLLVMIFTSLIGFMAFSSGARSLAQRTLPPASPFEAYLDIFPGQPMSALEGRGFSCQFAQNQNYYAKPPEVPEDQCLFTSAVGIFSAIKVVGSNQSIREVRFILRDNSLRLGDLLVMLAFPQFRSYHRTTFAFWRAYFVSALTAGSVMVNPVSQPLWSVTFALA